MNNRNKTEPYPVRLNTYSLGLALMWSAIVAASLSWNIHQTRQGTLNVARIQAQSAFMKDIIYRRWKAEQGKVYVFVTEHTGKSNI